MGKQLTKKVFGVPSAEVIGATENAQTVNEIRTANFRYEAQLRELERQFEAKAAESRQAYIDEVCTIYGDSSGQSGEEVRDKRVKR
jgi:hypothetical protein